MPTATDTAVTHDLDNFYRDKVNQHCRLPGIGEQDAYDLWHSATELVGSIDNLRRLIPTVGTAQVVALVQSFSRRMGNDPVTASLVAEVVLKAARSSLPRLPKVPSTVANQKGGDSA